MLLNDFYTLIKTETGAGSVNAVVVFNKGHRIFEGHFPGHPVVPGVCMMQTVREILEVATSQALTIATGDNVKFLSIINPEQTAEVEVNIAYTIDDNGYKVNATLFGGDVTFFKFKGTLKVSA